MTDLERVLNEAALHDEFYVWDGQCLSIAKAIHDHFGGRVVFASELPDEGFDHALVEVNNALYDGSGRVGWTETVIRFIARDAQREDPDDHFYYPDNPFGQFPGGVSQTTYQTAYDRLADAIEAVEGQTN